MFYAARILVSTLVVSTAGCLLSGCGQTGSLYLPPASTSIKPTSKLTPISQTEEAKRPVGQ
jgi:predicted small lipoprotein YifL